MPEIPFFIPTRDRTSSLQQLLVRLRELGQKPELTYLVDMDSTYEPMLDLLKLCEDDGYKVVRTGHNYGARGLFQKGIIAAHIGLTKPFFLSDPDVVPVEDCRKDLLAHMHRCLSRYTGHDKIGLSLKIDDIPDFYPLRERVIKWETKYSARVANVHLFHADVATTFCIIRSMHHADKIGVSRGSARLRDCWARHLSWYLDPDNLPPDEAYYYKHAPKRPWGAPVPGVSWQIEVKK